MGKNKDNKHFIFKENKYSSVREASRKTGICQWTIRKYGREVIPNE